jgi:hypothetical protein
MNATHTTFYLIQKIKQGFFFYTIFPVKKINVGQVLKLWENHCLIVLSIHILKLEISGCDIRCWRTPRQNLTVIFFETVGWTASPLSVHPVLLLLSWRVSVLFKLDHQIDRRFPPMDRRFIRRFCLHGFSSAIHPTQLKYGPSDHLTVPVDLRLLAVYQLHRRLYRWYRRSIQQWLFEGSDGD